MGPSVLGGPTVGSLSALGSRDIIVALDSFSFVDAVLRDPNRTSTTLANAAICLKAAKSNDNGALSTLKIVIDERSRVIGELRDNVLEEKYRLDTGGLVEDEQGGMREVEEEGMEEE